MAIHVRLSRPTSQRQRTAEHNVHVIAHHRVGVDANRKNLSQLLDARFNDRLAVFERSSGVTVEATKPTAPVSGSGGALLCKWLYPDAIDRPNVSRI